MLFYFLCCFFICCLGNDKHHPKTICISVFHLTALPRIFRTPTVRRKKKRFHPFLLVQQHYRAAKSPMLHFCFKAVTEAAAFWGLVAAVFYVDPRAVPVYIYTRLKPIAPLSDQSLQTYVHIVWSPAELSAVESRHSTRQLPSHGRLYFILLSLLKSFPSTVAPLILFSISPQRK